MRFTVRLTFVGCFVALASATPGWAQTYYGQPGELAPSYAPSANLLPANIPAAVVPPAPQYNPPVYQSPTYYQQNYYPSQYYPQTYYNGH